MLKQMISRFMGGAGGAGRRTTRGRGRGRSTGHGSTGARVGSMVERFLRRR